MIHLKFWNDDESSKEHRYRTPFIIFYAVAVSVVWAALCYFFYIVSNSTLGNRGLTELVVSVLPLVIVWGGAITIIILYQTRSEIDQLNAAVNRLAKFCSTLEAPPRNRIDSMNAGPVNPPRDETTHDAIEQTAPAYYEPLEIPDEVETLDDTSGYPDGSGDGAGPGHIGAEGRGAAYKTYLDDYGMPAAMLIRAMNFADSPDDTEALEAIETVRQHPEIATLMEQTYTILQRLAENGVSTDEMVVDYSDPDFLRTGAPMLTAKSLLGVGEIKTYHLLDAVSRMIVQDHDFTARVDEFIEHAVPVIRYLASVLTDREIERLTETRCIRALVLVRHAMEHY
ncbi:MAG: hypothetical protein OXC91_06130 [Rhodobacteraceae bacterium]|nr:hypothetical protein [Paracoccaceae bacterium]